MAIKYELPPFLEYMLTRQFYVRWLHHKAQGHGPKPTAQNLRSEGLFQWGLYAKLDR